MKTYFDKQRIIAIIIILFVLMLFAFFLFSDEFENNIYQNRAEIMDAFMCGGPDKNGQPKSKKSTFYDEFNDIYLCVFIEPNGYNSIFTVWKFGNEQYPIITSPTVEVLETGWLYFSILDISKDSNSEIEGYSDYILNGNLPKGLYLVEIIQQRTTLEKINFEVIK